MNPSLLRPTRTNNDFPIKVAIYVHSRYCEECFTVPVSHQVLLLPRDITTASFLDLIGPAFKTHPNFYDGNHKHDPFIHSGANTTGDIERNAVRNFHRNMRGAEILVLWPKSSPGKVMRTAITAENFEAMFTLLQARPGEAVLAIFIGWLGPVDFDTSPLKYTGLVKGVGNIKLITALYGLLDGLFLSSTTSALNDCRVFHFSLTHLSLNY